MIGIVAAVLALVAYVAALVLVMALCRLAARADALDRAGRGDKEDGC